MRIIINWSFYVILLLLFLGFINSIPISENKINSSKEKVDILKEENFNLKNEEGIVSKDERISFDTDKSIKENIRDNIKFKKEKDVKVNNDNDPILNSNHPNFNPFIVDDESVSDTKTLTLSSDNNSNVDNEFENKDKNSNSSGDKTNFNNTPFNNSDNENFNNTLFFSENKIDKIDEEKVEDKDKNKQCKNCDKTDEIKSDENEQGEIKSFKIDNNDTNINGNNVNSNNVDNNNSNSLIKNDKNSSFNGERKYMYASGLVVGVFLFFVICNIVMKVKTSQMKKKEVPSPNNRTLSLDLESFDSVDLRAGDLDSILSLETMEQYSGNNKVYIVDDGNNLKNIAKIYEIKGYKDHIFDRIEIGRNDSLNSLFDVSFNDNSVRSLPYL